MYLKIIAILVGLLILTTPPREPLKKNIDQSNNAPRTAIVNANVITMSEAGVLENHTVLVHGDTIYAIEPAADLDISSDYLTVDATGKFLLPGFMDMHVHLSGRENLLANLRYGVTSVLQMSGQRGQITDFLSLQDQISTGETKGPRLFLTGPMFDRLGLETQTTAYSMQEEDVPMVLRDHIAAGFDFVKVWNMTSLNVYRLLVRESTRPIIGHIPIQVSIEETLSSQVMIAHASNFYYKLFYDPSCPDGFWPCMAQVQADFGVLDELVERLLKSGIYLTANLSVISVEQSNDDDWNAVLEDPEFEYLDPAMQERWRRDNPLSRGDTRGLRRKDIDNQKGFIYELVNRANERGVPVLAGTDMGVEGVFPGKAIHLELRELVRAGLTPLDALKSATTTAAEFINTYVSGSRKIGEIQRGYGADLVLLHTDPLGDIENTNRIAGTMSRGIWHSLEALDQARDETIANRN